MPIFKRLVAQVHDIEADSPEQADEIARIRANATNTALRPLGYATAWAPLVSDGEPGADELMDDILADCYLLDERDDDPERNPRMGYVNVDETVIPERLVAWRDAAVKAALDAMLPPGIDERIAEITAFLKTVNFDYPDYGRLHDERAGLVRLKRDHEAAVKRALGGA